MREYERRHAAREQRARDRLGIAGVLIAKALGDPQSTRAWKQGAEGEGRLAKRLARLLNGTGVQLLHDRRVPGRKRANIDHIAIGPGGITIIDAKTLHGNVRVERVGGLFSPQRKLLRIAGRDRTSLVTGVQQQANALERLLVEVSVVEVDVRSALCFIEVDGLPFWRGLEIAETIIGGPKRVAKLASRAGALDENDVSNILERLGALLPPA